MEQFDYRLETRDGQQLFGRVWQPESQPVGVVNLVHGLGEHSGRYHHLAGALVGAGFALVSFDLRGHGCSGGPRGHAPSHELVFEDIDSLLRESARRYPGVPSFLYGHSLGGNLVLNYGLRRQPGLAGVIATSPWLRLAFAPPAWKVMIGRLMDRLVPRFTLPSGIDPVDLSHDPAVVSAYVNDPLVHDRLSARLGVGALENGQWALEHAGEFSLPLLLLHGGADRCTSADASREFARKAGSRCTLKIFDGLYHELHNEYEREEVISLIINWLERRAQREAGMVPETHLP